MRFEKISKVQFDKDFEGYIALYDNIKLPARATKDSAGYDFFTPIDITLGAGASMKIPTGVRAKLDNNKFLAIFPRSGLGFKFRTQLDNTVGICDSDYYSADNEGHIWIKMTNDSKEGKTLRLAAGDAIAQGIILQYFKMEEEEVKTERHGGFSSTDGNN